MSNVSTLLVRAMGLVLLVALTPASPAGAVAASITVTSPTDYRVFQRNAENRARIAIAGRYTGNPTTIQARWKYGPWTTIDRTLTRRSGTFYGVLPNQVAGQGPLHVRFSNLAGLVDTVAYVGIGDIFVMAGQSNVAGRGFTNHQFTPTTIRASMLGNDYRWKQLRDPYDSGVGQLDTVSKDSDAHMGSWVAFFANRHLRRVGVPVAFIPAAKGGARIAEWSRSTSRSTLYGSMLNRAKVTGGRVKAVLWFQGENNSNTSAGSYRASLNQLANNIASDLNGAPTIPAIIGSAPYPGLHRAGVRMGTLAAIAENENLLMGPAFYDVNIDDEGGDGLHFTSTEDLRIAGTRFWQAVNGALYGGVRGFGPESDHAIGVGNAIRLSFTGGLGEVTANNASFWVQADGVRLPVQSYIVTGNTITLQLRNPVPAHATVSLGHDNRSGINRAVYSEAGLPAVPFRDVRVLLSAP